MSTNTKCDHLRNELNKLNNMLHNQGKIVDCLRDHVRKNYIDGKKRYKKTLLNVYRILKVIAKEQLYNQKKINVSNFKERLGNLKTQNDEYFNWQSNIIIPPSENLRGQPMIGGIRPEMCCTFRLYKGGGNNVWVATDIGSISTAWNIIRRSFARNITLYLINDGVFNSAGIVRQGERWTEVKQRITQIGNQLGSDERRNDRIANDDETFTRILDGLHFDDLGTWNEISHLNSSTFCIEIMTLTEHTHNPNYVPFNSTLVMNIGVEKYISCKYMSYNINGCMTCLADFLIPNHSDPVWGHGIILLNSCMPKAIMTAYKASFDKYYGSQKKLPKVLNLAHIVEICQPTRQYEEGEEIGMTIDEGMCFFRKYRVGLLMFDQYGEILTEYIPENVNKNISPETLKLVYWNNHVVIATEINMIEQCNHNANRVEQCTLEASYNLPKLHRIDNDDFELVNHMSDLVSAIKKLLNRQEIVKQSQSNSGEKKKYVKVKPKIMKLIWNDPHMTLNDALIHLMDNGYQPDFRLQSLTVVMISLRNLLAFGNKYTITISPPTHIRGNTQIVVGSKDEYLKYINTENECESTLLHKQYLSKLTPNVETVFNTFCPPIPVGKCDTPCAGNTFVRYLDSVKCYPSCMMEFPYIPVVVEFEEFEAFHYDKKSDEPLDIKKLDDDYYYLTEIKNMDFIFNRKVQLNYGIVLKRILTVNPRFEFTIVGRLKLIKGEGITDVIRKIKTTLDPKEEGYTLDGVNAELQKGIWNKVIGKCNKQKNENIESRAFKSKNDADRQEATWLHEKSGTRKFQISENIWVVTRRVKKVKLEESFRPIYQMVLNMAQLKLYTVYQSLLSDGYTIRGVKTDAIYFDWNRESREPLQPKYLTHVTNCLGGFRLQESGVPPQILLAYKTFNDDVYKSLLFTSEELQSINIKVKNEWDSDAIINKLNAISDKNARHVNTTLFMGVGGGGKTTLATTYATKRYGADKVLAVCAYNATAQMFMHKYNGVKAITYHAWKGEGIDEKRTKKAYDTSGIQCIIFEELFLFNFRQLKRINRTIQKEKHAIKMLNDELHSESTLVEEDEDGNDKDNSKNISALEEKIVESRIEFLATGDPRQLEAINDSISNADKIRYAMTRSMFQYNIELKVNKRIKCPKQRKILEAVFDQLSKCPVGANVREYREALFKHYWPNNPILNSLGDLDKGKREKEGIKRGIAFMNLSANTTNKYIHENSIVHSGNGTTLDNGITYYPGGIIICKKSFRLDEQKLYTNYHYKIIKMDKAKFTIQGLLNTEMTHEVSTEKIMLSDHFSLPYCNTNHSSQGDAIDVPYVIVDWQNGMMDDNWLYTAISRCVDMNHVYFLDCDEVKEENNAYEAKQMVLKYGLQDARAKRDTYPDMYLNLDQHILKLYKQSKICRGCKRFMSFAKHADHKVTLNRANNAIGHSIANCPELLCVQCNRAESNRDDPDHDV